MGIYSHSLSLTHIRTHVIHGIHTLAIHISIYSMQCTYTKELAVESVRIVFTPSTIDGVGYFAVAGIPGGVC